MKTIIRVEWVKKIDQWQIHVTYDIKVTKEGERTPLKWVAHYYDGYRHSINLAIKLMDRHRDSVIRVIDSHGEIKQYTSPGAARLSIGGSR